MELLLLFGIGIAVSAFGAIVGFGGGIFMVPILVIFFQYPFDMAVGAVMISLLPASLISTAFNYKQKSIDYLVGTLIQAPTILGTIAGAFLVALVPVPALELVYSILVLGLGISMLQRPKKKQSLKLRKHTISYKMNSLPPVFIRKNRQRKAAYKVSAGLVMIFGLISGTVSGLFGIGGGFLSTPMMIKLLKIPAKIATSTALFTIILTSVTGSVSHYFLGHIDAGLAMPLVAAFAVGAVGGNLLKIKEKNNRLELLIGVGLLLAGAATLVNLLATT